MFATKLLSKIKLPYKINIDVDFPPMIEYAGEEYIQTGKKAQQFITGLPSAEYESVEGLRIWMYADGSFGDS